MKNPNDLPYRPAYKQFYRLLREGPNRFTRAVCNGRCWITDVGKKRLCIRLRPDGKTLYNDVEWLEEEAIRSAKRDLGIISGRGLSGWL